MERLTELKVGMELPIAVLKAWTQAGRHYWDISKSSWTQAYGDTVFGDRDKKITSINNKHSFYVGGIKGLTDIDLLQEGFIEFYNKFYNLDQPMKTRIEDWHNCVFYFNKREQGEQIISRLKLIGFDAIRIDSADVYVRTEERGTALVRHNHRDGWSGSLNNPREFEYEEAIAALSGQPVSKPKAWTKEMLIGNKFPVPVDDRKTCEQIWDYLRSFGLKFSGSDPYTYVGKAVALYIHPGGSLSYSGSDYSATIYETHLKLISYKEFLPSCQTTQLINTNNTPLNTKTDGEVIIRRKTTTITDGQRPTGSVVRGRTSRTQIVSGHLSYQALSSER